MHITLMGSPEGMPDYQIFRIVLRRLLLGLQQEPRQVGYKKKFYLSTCITILKPSDTLYKRSISQFKKYNVSYPAYYVGKTQNFSLDVIRPPIA